MILDQFSFAFIQIHIIFKGYLFEVSLIAIILLDLKLSFIFYINKL